MSDQSEAVARQAAAEEKAADARQAARDKAAGSKGVPEGAGPPPTRGGTRGGDVQIARERLIEHSRAYLGVPSHVLVGALYGDKREYLTVDQARDAVEEFRQRPVTSA